METIYVDPENYGIDSGKLREMLEVLEKEAALHSISVKYEGKTILEGAWKPFTLEAPQMMHSLSKTGTAICVGFARDEGKLKLEAPFLDYIREDLPEEYDPALEKITVYELLTMQAGSPFCCNNVWFSRLEKNWETAWLREKKILEEIGNMFGIGKTKTRELLQSRLLPVTKIGRDYFTSKTAIQDFLNKNVCKD